MVRLQPVVLAKHGSRARAQICEDACPQCGPVRARVLRDARYRRRTLPPRTPRELTEEDWATIARLMRAGVALRQLAHAYRLEYAALWVALQRRD